MENTTPKPTRHYGWRPPAGPPHPKLLFRARHAVRTTNPAAVDLRPKDSPIQNQGQLGSCTGNAWAGAIDFKERNAPVLVPRLGFWARVAVALGLKRRPTPPAARTFTASRLFIYYNERALEGTTGSDAGAAVADGARVVATQGVCPEETWPYDVARFTVRPSASAYDLATQHTVAAPAAVDVTDLDEVRTALASGHPIVFGFSVYTSFESLTKGAATYIPRGRYAGGHAVLAVGYDDAKQVIIVRNSWGPEWGEDGYFFMPYSVFTNPKITSDAWALTS